MGNSLKRLKKKVIKPLHKLANFSKLISGDFKVIFNNEGSFQVSLPSVSYIDAIFFDSRKFKKLSEFSVRPNKEPLLRKIIFELFSQGFLEKNKSVIDIGCWLADNSLVWASYLEKDAVVFAIDPSKDNISFSQELAEYNDITNIAWVQAVCSDLPGQQLTHSGSIDHARFGEANTDDTNSITSRTLDEIVASSDHQEISLIHVDVEGFEEKVLKGADQIIERSRPVIVFEQHISTEDIWPIVYFLKSKNYSVYMINEVLSGCNLDCRNFIAFNNDQKKPAMIDINHSLGGENSIWYASMQGAIIPLE